MCAYCWFKWQVLYDYIVMNKHLSCSLSGLEKMMVFVICVAFNVAFGWWILLTQLIVLEKESAVTFTYLSGIMGRSLWRTRPHSFCWLCVEIFSEMLHYVEVPLLHHCYSNLWNSNCHLLGLLLCLCSILPHLGHHASNSWLANWMCNLPEDHENPDGHMLWALLWSIRENI